jgi:hypothetical protein
LHCLQALWSLPRILRSISGKWNAPMVNGDKNYALDFGVFFIRRHLVAIW